jgi:phosphoadenosine phosphosulfate reductase
MRDEHELLDDVEAGELAVDFDDQPPEAVLQWAIERYGSRVALCTSFQAEGMVLLDLAWRIDPKVRVFTIDTGRMHQ